MRYVCDPNGKWNMIERIQSDNMVVTNFYEERHGKVVYDVFITEPADKCAKRANDNFFILTEQHYVNEELADVLDITTI